MGVAGVATSLVLGVAFVATGAPRPFLLTALAFVAAMLPVGAIVVWIPVALYFVARGHYYDAALLTAIGIVLVGGVIDHALVVAAFGLLMLQPQLARGERADTR